MAGRTRRTRLLILLVFGVVAFVLYTRNATPVDDYREYFKNKAIGGGAVIRPKEGEEENPYKPPTAPIPDAAAANEQRPPGPPPAPAPPKEEQTTSTTTESAPSSDSTTSGGVAADDPTPPPPTHLLDDDELPYEIGEGRVEVPVITHKPTTTAHWSKLPEHFPVTSTIQLPSGTSIPFPRLQKEVKKLADAGADKERLAIVKGVTEHAWKGYKDFALGFDEIKPISTEVRNPFNGWGATLVDSLDTLWITGMEEEFEEAVVAVGKIDFTTSPRRDIPVFETTIRYLGGLIAAYDVSGKKHIVLLDKAVEIAEVLFSIFDTPNRMPQTYFQWRPSFASQPHRASNRVILAEIGTLSLEFTRLAQLTKEPKYYDAIARITDLFEAWQNSTRLPGMWPTTFDASGCNRTATRIMQMEAEEKLAQENAGKTTVDGGGNKLEADPYELKKGLQKSLDESVAAREPGVGKIKQVGDSPTVDTGTKKELLSGELGSTKLKRNGGDLDTLSESKEARTPPEGSPPQSSGPGKGTTTTQQAQKLEDCVPQGFDSMSASNGEKFTFSGASDSMYEYLPKQYLLLGGLVEQYRSMYLDSANKAIEKLLYKPMTMEERDILMTGELVLTPNHSTPAHQREYIEKFRPEVAHLACFAGGMFAMGGVLFNKPEHVEIGAKLTDGCVWAYNATATGIMPEGAELMMCPDTWGKCPWNETAYWEVLDPYQESRLNPPRPVGQPPAGSSGDSGGSTDGSHDNDFAPPSKVVSEAEIGPQLPKPDDDDTSNLAKRQLDSANPPPPSPARAPLPVGSLTSSPVENIDPFYTPEPPLSHAAYVAAKIAEERLPPGYTKINFRSYILRPEAIESVFYLYRITGDKYWRDVGWDMFTSIDRHTKAMHGNSAIDDVTKSAPEQLDQMESFWVAETLKYFYLLYDEPGRWSLDEWVFNTEAHLFRRPEGEFLPEKFS